MTNRNNNENGNQNFGDIQINQSLGNQNEYIDRAILVSFDFGQKSSQHNIYLSDINSDEADYESVESSADDGEDAQLNFNQSEDETPSEPIELYLLAHSAGADIVHQYIRHRKFQPTAATYISKGHIENIRDLVKQFEATVVIFDHALSPIQERNLEKEFSCRVMDRTRLILDIFAMRAQTKEGKLQVELAQLKYMSTRLVRGWTHLERQKGGIGLRGPGETQLESDRRMVRYRIGMLEKRLEKVEAQRALQRRQRDRTPVSTISLVGYTNAGKSSLFNRLTESDVFVEDKLFATLDPTMRKLELECGEVILTDTVGFVRDLPHTLVKAFHATLEEIANADLLLHVVDIANEDYQSLINEVNKVLEEINAQDIPVIYVFNKADKLPKESLPKQLKIENSDGTTLFVSAHSGLGTAELIDYINQYFSEKYLDKEIHLLATEGKLRSILYQNNWAKDEAILEDGSMNISVSLSQADWDWLNHHFTLKETSINQH